MQVGNFMGLLDLEALVQSRNVVSVKLLQEVSIKDAKKSLENLVSTKKSCQMICL